ncbi:DUF5677 domain-containing protein [Paraburkholderia azotifigens]|uniref:DUF5677 domain-containing protein n=1 Tax=Paraburkholderia azotifigens TaxID=2057004 RepID=UPI0031766EBD
MKAIPLEDLRESMVWAIAGFARALGAFQGCILMAERGALAEARSLARLCAEAVIVTKGLVMLDDTLDLLSEDDANHDLRVIDRLLEINQGNADADGEQLARFAARKAELEARFPRRRSLNYRTLALNTGLELFYELAYRYTSGNGAHATLGAFVRHMREGIDGEPDGYFFGPDVTDMASTLLCANVAVTELLAIAIDHLGCEADAAELTDLRLHWQMIRGDLEAAAAAENGN